MTVTEPPAPVPPVPAASPPAATASRPPRSARPARRAALAVGVVVAVLVAVLATRRPAADVVAPSPMVGRAAPEVAGRAVVGTPVRLGDLRGRWVVVNFFATWCIPCVREHPELVRFAGRHAPAEVAILGVVYDDDADAVARFFDEHGGDWPVVDDSGAKVDFGVRGVPESFLVDPDGVVRTRLVGGVTAAGLDAVLRAAGAR